MTDRRGPLSALGDEELGAELRMLASWLDFGPTPVSSRAGDPANVARRRIEAAAMARRRWWPFGSGVRPLRRSLVLAVVALVILAAIVGAIGLGVPGIRVIFTGATPTPSASPSPGPGLSPAESASPTPSSTSSGPPGSGLDLGFATTTAEAAGLSGFAVALPADPTIGEPDEAWYREGRLSLVWKSRPGLPETEAAGIGLLLTEFRGSVERDFFEKMLGPGTTMTPVTVGGVTGYWISGAPHDFMYLDPSGQVVFDTRRAVGDTLIWAHGDLTFRLESSLGRAATIRLAETIH